MKVALYSRQGNNNSHAAIQTLINVLDSHNITTTWAEDNSNLDGYDYLISIGGDGTLLSAVQLVLNGSHDMFPPVLGINFGHLGFLTSGNPDNIDSLIADLLAGNFTLEERTLLSIANNTSPIQEHQYALNELFLRRSDNATLLSTEIFINDEYVATYTGDGVIVATPTGSTAYSLSCGGPILTPNSKCFVITPIAAHTLTLRPIIVPDNATIKMYSHHNNAITLGIDSRRENISGETTFILRRAPFTIRLVRMNNQNFFSAIREKLMWGTEIGNN